MQAHGTITAAMSLAGSQLASCILTGAPPVLLLLGRLGWPAGSCLVHVLGLGWSLKDWAQDGWQGPPIAQETASGILTGALGALADGDARLLLDGALEAAARRGIAA